MVILEKISKDRGILKMKVKDLVLTKIQTGIRWKIDGELFLRTEVIPKYIMEKYLYEWDVSPENYILVMTYVSK